MTFIIIAFYLIIVLCSLCTALVTDEALANNHSGASWGEDKSTILKIIDTMLTKKKFKDFFNKNVATL